VRSFTVTSGKGFGVIGLKAGERHIEHFPARYDDHIESRWRFLSPEQLAGEPLGSVSNNGRPELPCGGNTKATPRAAVRRDEQGHEPPVQPNALLVGPFEFRASPDPLVPGKALRHRALRRLLLVGDGQAFSALCPATFQHNSAVFCRHTDAEAVRLAAAASIRLKRAFTLCHSVLHEVSERRGVGLSNSQY
jgi:hypothetical protein